MDGTVKVTVTFEASEEALDEDGRLGEDAFGEIMDVCASWGENVQIREL